MFGSKNQKTLTGNLKSVPVPILFTMTTWILHPTRLVGETVELWPLERSHYNDLKMLATPKEIWQFYTFDGSNPDRLTEVLDATLADRDQGLQYPFVIYHQPEQRIIGNTRLMDIQIQNRKLEIGGTWLHPRYWATEVNPECKLLLLTFCFEQLKAIRVQLKTDENNWRSRKAILKIGAQFEGVLRHDMIRDNKTFRNSAYYSILDSEWLVVRQSLAALYKSRCKSE